jgi:uncharacterized protein YbaR (Trm112 family)
MPMGELAEKLIEILQCPCSKQGKLQQVQNNLVCSRCEHIFEVLNDIPVLLPELPKI